MELNYDWKSFQNFFYTKKQTMQSDPSGPVYLVVEGRAIVSAFSECEDLSDWVGSTCDELAVEFPHREVILYDREKVDQWMNSSLTQKHFYDQIQHICAESRPTGVPKGRLKTIGLAYHRHFLLNAIQSHWAKFFPSSYGILIRLDQGQGLSFLIIVQRGRIHSFQVPDLSSMIPDRRRYPEDIVKFLSEKYLVPIQGLFLTTSEWTEWSESPNPWPKMASALKRNREKVIPFRWGLALMVTLKGYFGL